MFLLTLPALLLIFTGVCEGQYRQKLTCPYTSDQKNMQRVWCKRDDVRQHCCTGFTFETGIVQLEGGRLSVQDNGQAFVVSVSSPPQGDGVYWCGLKNGTDVIIKLAESQLYTISGGFIWDILRWVLFLLLLLAVIATCIYSNRKYGGEKKRDKRNENVMGEKQR